MAIACLESAYGTSKLAIEKNNLFGLRANDEYRDAPSKYGDYFSTLNEDEVDAYNLKNESEVPSYEY